ncbi:MAG: FHA domain-containing protein [Thermoleophilaceae bacterium]
MTDVQLKIVDGPDSGREFPIAGALVIGRDPSAGIVLEDTEVSRRHAQVAPRSSGVVIEDLGSTNGTFVNGEQIEGERPLHGGEKVRIGTTVLEVSVPVQATKIASVIPEEPADPNATRMASIMSPEEAERAAAAAEDAPAAEEDDEATVVPEEAEAAAGGTEAPATEAPPAPQPPPAAAPEPPTPPPIAPPPAVAGPQSPATPPPPAGFQSPPPPPPAGGPQAPLPAPPAQAQPPAGYQAGPGFCVRGPGEQWALCALVPFYSLIWYYRLCKEIGEWSAGRIPTNPTTSILAMTLGAFIVVPPWVSLAGTMGRIRQCQQMAGLQPQASFWGFFGRALLLGYGYKWLTEQLNELAVRRPVQ